MVLLPVAAHVKPSHLVDAVHGVEAVQPELVGRDVDVPVLAQQAAQVLLDLTAVVGAVPVDTVPGIDERQRLTCCCGG